MPPVAAAVGGAAALIGGTGFGAILTNALISTALNFAVGQVIQTFFPADNPQQQVSSASPPSGVELQFRSGVDVPVSAIVGVRDTPGHFAYHNSYGADNEFLQLLFIDGNAEHDAMIALLTDNKTMTLSGSNADPRGFVVEEFREAGEPYLWAKYYTGAVGQGADAELVAHANPSGRWTSACKLTATAYCIITLRFNQNLFGGSIPNFRRVWRGLKFYDRRKDSTQPGGSGPHRWGVPSTYEWTECPAIVQDNWRLGVWVNGVRLLGLGVSEFDCRHAGIVAAANVCDEQVIYPDTGRTLPRYAIGLEVKDGTDPITMMRLFEAAMGGHGSELGGAYAPLPAQTMVPVLTLTDKDRVTGEDAIEQTRMSPIEIKTAFHGMFLSPDDGWQPIEYGIRADTAVEALEGGRRLEEFDATFVRHREIAATLAEIKRRRDRYSAIEVAVYGPDARDLVPGQVITRESELFGTILMEVQGVTPLPRKCFRLSLRSWHNSIVPIPGGGFLPEPVTPIPAPTPVRLTHPLALLAVPAEQVSGTSKVPAIRVTWTPITDTTVTRVILKYWPTANPTDFRWQSIDAPGSGIAVIEGVAPLTEYQVIATIQTSPARLTDYTNPATVMTSAMLVDAEVADNSVTIAKLVQEARNRLDLVFNELPNRIVDIEAEMARQADASLTQSQTDRKKTTLLKAATANAIAAVIREEAARVEDNAAFAMALLQVSAEIDNFAAGGLIEFRATAGPGASTSTIAIMGRAQAGDDAVEGGIFMRFTADGLGGTSSELLLDIRKLLVTDGVNTAEAFTFDTTTGTLVLKSLRFEDIKSIDGTTIVLDGIGGGFSVTVP